MPMIKKESTMLTRYRNRLLTANSKSDKCFSGSQFGNIYLNSFKKLLYPMNKLFKVYS